MKGRLILLTILIGGFLLFVFVKYFYLDRKNEFGQLKIISSPSATVFIDNVATNKTPFQGQLKVGEIILKLIPQGEATNTASWQGKVKIYRNTLTYVKLELGSSDSTSAGEVFTATRMDKSAGPDMGEIFIETDPVGAIVSLNNDDKGVAPVLLSDVPKGQHELSVLMPGFFRRTQKVNVETGYRVNAHFKLALDENAQKAQESQKQATQSASPPKKTLVIIKDTPTGFLRVRSEPSVNASESAQVKPDDRFDFLDEQNGWYKIRYESGKEGWVYSQYADKQTQ